MAPAKSAGANGTRTIESAPATIAAVSSTPGPASTAIAIHWRRIARKFKFHAASKSSGGRKTYSVAWPSAYASLPGAISP
jgi:hypothetical protein